MKYIASHRTSLVTNISNYIQSELYYIVKHSSFLIAFTLLLSFTTVAQTTGKPDRGVQNNVPYQASQIENINLQNGAVNLTIPLASLPSLSGGKLSYTLNAYYSSKVWDSYSKEEWLTPFAPGDDQSDDPLNDGTLYFKSVPKKSSSGGWRIGGKHRIETELASNDFVRHTMFFSQGGSDATIVQAHNWHKTVLVTPAGARHELRPLGYSTSNAVSDFYRGYYKDSPYTTGTPIKYYSIDGSYLSVTINPPNSPMKWEAHMRDGTRIQDWGDYQRILDTNNNKIKIFNDSLGQHFQDELTGREIRISNNKVYYKTVGGAEVSVDIIWGTTTVSGKYYDIEVPDSQNTHCDYQEEFSATFSVIREIKFPQTEVGIVRPKMTFEYNSDSSSARSDTYTTPGCNSYPITINNPSVGLGELNKIIFPNGKINEYEYLLDGENNTSHGDVTATHNTIKKKKVSHDGQTDVWNYSIGATFTQITNPDGSTHASKSYFHSPGQLSIKGGANGFGGLVYQETSSNKIRTEKRWKRMVFSGAEDAWESDKAVFNPVVTEEYISVLDNNGNPIKMSAKEFTHDYNGNITQVKEYDWFSPSLVTRDAEGIPNEVPLNAVLLKTTSTSYYNSAATASSPNVYGKTNNLILNAPKEAIIGGSKSKYAYDGLAYGIAPVKGNVTKISTWLDTTNQWLDVATSYDSYGNPIEITDPKGNITQIFYEDATHALPTKTIIDPQNGTGQQIALNTYDFSTGLPLDSTDPNGNVSSFDYTNNLLGAVDPHGRPGKIISPQIELEGVNKKATVKYFYYDNDQKTETFSDMFDENDGKFKTRTSRDQLGRTILTERNENGASAYTISSKTIFNTIDRTVLTSNPMRSTAASTDGWARAKVDDLGRTIEVSTFQGTSEPPIAGTNTDWTGTTTTSYEQNTVTVTDQAGKKRRSVTDAAGRLIRIDEPDSSGNLGTLTNPLQPTNYTYDVLNNLTTVNQGGQTRIFTYDSLSRLKSANNPESGLIQYSYDANGNLTSKTDAKNITTTYTYDKLNRVKTRSYNDGLTPKVTYTYDNKTNAVGQLTKIVTGLTSTPFSVTEYQVFDKFGRVTQSQQTTDGETYNPMTYKYNLSGAMTEQKYPSGRIVKNVLDNDGMLSMIQSKKDANSGYFNYAKSFRYNATGAVESMQLGNGKWESTTFNSRLQPTQIALGTTQGGTDKLKLDYTYGTTTNNGNVQSQAITVERSNQSPLVFNQSYVYDELNRLKSAEETSNNATTWKQTYNFDRYGNRTFDTTGNNTTTLGQNFNPNIANPTADESNNRFTTSQGYVYDLNGNLIEDASGRTFIYDGENKQKEAKNSSSLSLGKYFFDGEGKRVKKETPTETIIFIYDASSKLVAEYSTEVSNEPKVQYLTEDTLGTPRIVTDKDGDIISRSDYMPYGEEIIGYGNRTATDNYESDDVRQGFTGYEKDDETGLDYAQARMYNNSLGRFTATDPIKMKQDRQIDPQRINLYVYVRNNPLKYIDPFGEDLVIFDKKAEQRILDTLPKEIVEQVREVMNSNDRGWLCKGALDNIKSNNENFLDLKAIVDGEGVVEVMTASNDETGADFEFKSAEQQEAEDKAAGEVPIGEVDEKGNPLPAKYEDTNYSGRTITPKQNKDTGQIRVILADGKGKTKTLPGVEAAKTTAHELYGHAKRLQAGKPWKHDGKPGKPGPIDKEIKKKEERTEKIFKNRN